MTAEADAPQWKIMRSDGGFSDLVGPILARNEGTKEEPSWAYAFQAEARHENRQGAIHGGMLMTFADQAIGAIAWEAGGRRKCVTMQLDTQFIAAARAGDLVECRAEVVRAARTVIFVRGTLSVAGKPVLSASGIWKVIGAE